MRMGFPRLLTSDQGGEFKSDLDQEMMKELGIISIFHHIISPSGNVVYSMSLLSFNFALIC